MDRAYEIIVDATIDLPESLAGKMQIIPMRVQFEVDEIICDANWDEEKSKAFYARLRDKQLATTSQIPPYTYEQNFDRVLKQGKDVLYLCFSSGLSNTIESAQLAAQTMGERYPDQKIRIVDSKSASFGLATMLEEMLKNQCAGMSIDENADWMESYLLEYAVWFTVEDLMFLKHGGRISAAAALLGTTFRIMPVMHIDEVGKLPVVEKVQGRKSAMKTIIRQLEHLHAGEDRVYIIHADAIEDAKLMQKLIQKAYPQIGEVIIGQLGPVVGCHAGPGTLALAFRGKER